MAPVRFLFQRRGLVRLSTAASDAEVEQFIEEALAEAEDFEQAEARELDGSQEIEVLISRHLFRPTLTDAPHSSSAP
jgi:transcriptional/translational regulatory protein YebC/TACO1